MSDNYRELINRIDSVHIDNFRSVEEAADYVQELQEELKGMMIDETMQ